MSVKVCVVFKTIPLSLKAANDFVTSHHRHNKKTAGHKFSLGVLKENELVGVANWAHHDLRDMRTRISVYALKSL